MTRVEQDILKKSELNSTIRTIASTVSILVGMYFGGVEIKDGIVTALKNEIRQEFTAEIKEVKNEMRAFDIRLTNMENANRGMGITVK